MLFAANSLVILSWPYHLQWPSGIGILKVLVLRFWMISIGYFNQLQCTQTFFSLWFSHFWIAHLYVLYDVSISFSIIFLCSAIILNNENSSIHIDAVLDPLSPTSQRLSGILRVLWKYIQPSMRIVLNPVVGSNLSIVLQTWIIIW